jgi:glycosyltransferase involved in cell wall biosynthesis
LTSQSPPFDDLVQPLWGSTVDEHDTLMVVDQIRQLLLNSEHRHTMGQAGREHVLENYTWDRVADAYLTALG